MATIDFGGVKEEVIMRKEFPMARHLRFSKMKQLLLLDMACKVPLSR